MAAISTGPISPPLRPSADSAPAPDAHSGSLDFISTYADYADVLEAPREAHEAVAILLIAAVTNGFVRIQHGALSLTMDLWLLFLSGSGLGRNTLTGLAYPILSESGHDALLRRTTWGSGPAFYEDLARNLRGLHVWPEMSQVLKTLSQIQFNGAKEWLTDRFDSIHRPDDVVYRTTAGSQRTPPIVFTDAPRTNILATSSLDWFVSSLAREDTTGGFVPRWFIVSVADTGRVIPKPKEPDKRLIKPLGAHVSKAGQLRGVADLSQVEDLYGDWYRAAQSRFAAQHNKGLAVPFFNRLRALVLKLAVIYEISATCRIFVSPSAMSRALSQAALIEQTVFRLVPTGMTAEGFAIDRMEQAIREAGVAGITQSALTRAFQHYRLSERIERLKTLHQGGRVQPFQKPSSGGRPANIFVHSDFSAQHQKDFPTDTANDP
jgi:hypothetical protein